MKTMEFEHNDVTTKSPEYNEGMFCLAVAHGRKGCGGGSDLEV